MASMKKLRGKMIERGFDAGSLAEAIKISKSTFYRKLAGNGQGFTVREATKIAQVLGLSAEEAAIIFFSHEVA